MLVLVPVFGGECFSNHFKCSLVLKHEYFLKLAELAVCLACPHGMKSSSCQSIFQLSCHFPTISLLLVCHYGRHCLPLFPYVTG